jgi:hypothetical protein
MAAGIKTGYADVTNHNQIKGGITAPFHRKYPQFVNFRRPFFQAVRLVFLLEFASCQS